MLIRRIPIREDLPNTVYTHAMPQAASMLWTVSWSLTEWRSKQAGRATASRNASRTGDNQRTPCVKMSERLNMCRSMP